MTAKTHGESCTKLYKCWVWMRKRCRDADDPKNYRYAGRGIKVCDEWQNSYENFREWAITHGYREGLTIDRIDNDGNYEPRNCRWVTRKKQNNNRCDNNMITYNGKTQTLHEWTDELNLPYHETWQRLYRLNWSVERAFTTLSIRRMKKND